MIHFFFPKRLLSLFSNDNNFHTFWTSMEKYEGEIVVCHFLAHVLVIDLYLFRCLYDFGE